MPEFTIIDIDSHLVGWSAAKLRLERMEAALASMHEPLKEIIDDVERQTVTQFATWGEAAGTPWEPLAPDTIAEKAREGSPFPEWPLVRGGEMMESAISQHGGPYSEGETLNMEAWMGVDWEEHGWQIPALHQEGVMPELVSRRPYTRHDGTQVEGTSYLWHLPSRPMFVATEALAEAGAEHIVGWVMSPWP